MAASYNRVLLMGNLTRNPELRYISGGSAVCEFGIAMNRRFVAGGQDREETTFVDIVVWGKSAESCSRFLAKGSSVFIEGRLQLDQWEDQQGGKRSRLRVVAENVQFVGARRDGGNADAMPQNAPSGQPNGGYQPRSGGAPQSGPGGYQMRGNARPQNGGNDAPPVPEEAFNVGDDVEDDIPF